MFAVRGVHLLEAIGIIETQGRRHNVVAEVIQKYSGPTQRRGRIAHSGDGVPDVVLAIAEGTFAILPCLSPVDGGEADKEAARVHYQRLTQETAPFEAVIATDVVINPTLEPGQLRHDGIAFGRMQVAAGRIAAKCPAIPAVFLPRRQAQRQLEEDAERLQTELLGRHGAGAVQIRKRRRHMVGEER
jgi:hypothetical protein